MRGLRLDHLTNRACVFFHAKSIIYVFDHVVQQFLYDFCLSNQKTFHANERPENEKRKMSEYYGKKKNVKHGYMI